MDFYCIKDGYNHIIICLKKPRNKSITLKHEGKGVGCSRLLKTLLLSKVFQSLRSKVVLNDHET